MAVLLLLISSVLLLAQDVHSMTGLPHSNVQESSDDVQTLGQRERQNPTIVDELRRVDEQLLQDSIKVYAGNATAAVIHVEKGTSSTSWKAVGALGILILMAISPIAVKEGLTPFVTVVVYLACLTLVKMYVKETMTLGFEFPDSITAVHMIATAILAASFERPRLSEAFLVLPISVVNGVSLILNNTALVHGGVAFISMVSACTPIFTFSLELARGKRGFDVISCSSVLVVCLGSAFCVHGEKAASLVAALFAIGSTAFRATKSVWQHEILTINVSPFRLVFWSGFWSFWITIPMIAASEGLGASIRAFPETSSKTKTDFLLSIIAACILNISQVYAVKQLGALMQSIVGNLNLILVIVLSQAWLQEEVTLWQFIGVGLLVAGTVMSKMADKKKSQKPSKDAEETQCLAAEKAPEGYSSTGTSKGDQ